MMSAHHATEAWQEIVEIAAAFWQDEWGERPLDKATSDAMAAMIPPEILEALNFDHPREVFYDAVVYRLTRLHHAHGTEEDAP